jgi:hypothetical protein
VRPPLGRIVAFVLVAVAPSLAAAQVQEDVPAQATEDATVSTDAAVSIGSAQEPTTPPEFPGMWQIPDTQTWFGVHGFAMLDVMHDFDAIGSVDDFEPGTIPIGGGDNVDGAAGRTNFSFRQTRFSLESKSKVGDGRIDSFISLDFFGGTSDDPLPRLRQGYFSLVGLAGGGDLVVGQTYSTFVDMAVVPDTLDYEMSVGVIFIRQPLVRWNRDLGPVTFMASAEKPETDLAEGDALTKWPDGVVAVQWGGGWGHLKAGGLLRELRSSLDDGNPAASFAAGVTFSAALNTTEAGDTLGIQITGGKGIGRYLEESMADGTINPITGELDTFDHLGGIVTYRHFWAARLRSSATYSWARVDIGDIVAPEALRSVKYASGNLLWSPYDKVDFGLELMWGKRENQDAASGTARRIQFSGKYAFGGEPCP